MHTQEVAGAVATLWRYPVKSMQGEELDAAEITAGGLLGDRRFAVIEAATGMLANAKNPRRWPRFYSFRAAYTEPPRAGSALPAVRISDVRHIRHEGQQWGCGSSRDRERVDA